MSIITLTTDLGLKDYYVASIKGHILSQLPDASIIDVSHDIPPFNISVAAFCLKNCYQDFPEGIISLELITGCFHYCLMKSQPKFSI